jgi:DNA-binding transcriptional ArsR family regulator
VKTYSHPAIREVPLHAVMQAMSDPCRLTIVHELLREKGRAIACNEVRLDVSKATRSHHFDVLRAAGIIFTEMNGTKCMTSLRRKDLEQRFPGLLTLISARKKDAVNYQAAGHGSKIKAKDKG